MKTFFPENAVEYFVSYYDYYQPEALRAADRQPSSRKGFVDQRADRPHAPLRDARRLMERDDVIIVGLGLSCIYGIGPGWRTTRR